jgi:multicomponent Na+:H+ antiporter subunit E
MTEEPVLIQSLSVALTLFAFWLLLSGYFTAFLVAAGAGAAIAVALLARRMEVVDREGHPVELTLRALGYWPWLAKEIVKSGLQVSRIILDPRLPISPTLARFRPSQASTVGLVIHANSITLTPGTVTVEADRGEFLVHALTREAAAGLADSEMDRRVTRLEGAP